MKNTKYHKPDVRSVALILSR